MNLNRLFTSRLWSFVALTGGNRKGALKFRDGQIRQIRFSLSAYY